LEQQLGDLADRAPAAVRRRDVMGGALDLGTRVGGGDGQAHAAHDHDVGEIVAGVGGLLRRQAAFGEDLLEDRNFLDVTLVHVGHLDLAGALDCGGRIAPADDPGGDAVPGEPLQRDAVL